MTKVAWVSDGPKLSDPELLRQIADILDNESSIVVEHCHFFGAREPTRLVFNHYEDMTDYIRSKVRPGDKFHFWVFERCCSAETMLTYALMENADGLVPDGGSY